VKSNFVSQVKVVVALLVPWFKLVLYIFSTFISVIQEGETISKLSQISNLFFTSTLTNLFFSSYSLSIPKNAFVP
jgi:hypothetical protein